MEAMSAMRWTGLKVRGVCLGWLLLLTAAVGKASGQGASAIAAPQASLTDELGSLASRAAVIFAGQVISIEHHGGAVEIEFRVEQPVYGTVGASYTLREWAGLWPQGQVRYIVGQRALVFMHAASATGFASPVDGAEGVVPVVVQGADAPELLDVRRLGAAVLRAPGTPLPTEADGAIQLADAVAVIAAALQPASATKPFRFKPPLRLPLPTRAVPVASPSNFPEMSAQTAQPVLAGGAIQALLRAGSTGKPEVSYGSR